MVTDLRHVVFSLCCLENAKKQKHEETTNKVGQSFCRLFVFSHFEAKKAKIQQEGENTTHKILSLDKKNK
jgi:hypothetical protein